MAVRKITIPGPDVLIQTANGINPDWYEKLKFLEILGPLSDIAKPTLPSPLTPGSTSASVTTVALSDISSPPGNVNTTIDYGGSPTAAKVQDNFTTLAAHNNTILTDLQALQTAIGALNTRVTAAENEFNALLTALS